MNESGEQGPAKSERGGRAGFVLKAVLWDKPLFMLALSTVLLCMSLPLVLLLVRVAGDGRLARLDHRFSVEMVILVLSLPAFFACMFAVACFVLLRRKRKTGRFLLSRGELKQKIARDLEPKPMWKRILVSGIYLLLACDMTFDAMSTSITVDSIGLWLS